MWGIQLLVNTVLRQDEAGHYPTEFLDTVTAPRLPAHEFKFKVGVPIMLLRKLHPPKLCSRKWLRVRSLLRYVIEAVILTGCDVGDVVFVPRIPLISSNYPFEFKLVQFFAMTINKSRRQTLSIAGIELGGTQCFSWGQLYVVYSRVKSPASLFIYAPGGRTTNVVYEEALRRFIAPTPTVTVPVVMCRTLRIIVTNLTLLQSSLIFFIPVCHFGVSISNLLQIF